MKRRALLTGLLALPFAALGAHGVIAGEGRIGTRHLGRLYGMGTRHLGRLYGMGTRHISIVDGRKFGKTEAAEIAAEWRKYNKEVVRLYGEYNWRRS